MAIHPARAQRDVPYRPLLIAVCSGAILAPLNTTMIAVGLPSIREEFSLGHTEIAWLASSYLIAMAVSQPIGGRLGDQLGRSLVYRSGLVAFLASSLLASVAPNFALLMVFRTTQSLAGAIVIPNGLAMLRESLPNSHLGRSAGALSSAAALAAAFGPLLGALMLEAGSWRLLFLVNVPLVSVAFGAHTLLRYANRIAPSQVRLDVPGAVVLAATLTTATLFIGSMGDGGGRLVAVWGVAAVTLLVAFAGLQLKSRAPFAEWALFRNRGFTGATFFILLNTLVMYTVLLTIPFYTEELLGRSGLYTGVVLGLHAGCMAVGAPVGGRLSDVFGRRFPVAVSSLVVLFSCGLLAASITREGNFLILAAPLAAMGVGLGMGQGAANAAAIEAAPRELAGAAAGTNSMMRWLGGVLGVALLGTILNTGAAAPPLHLFRWIFVVLTGGSALSCLFAMMIHRRVPVSE